MLEKLFILIKNRGLVLNHKKAPGDSGAWSYLFTRNSQIELAAINLSEE